MGVVPRYTEPRQDGWDTLGLQCRHDRERPAGAGQERAGSQHLLEGSLRQLQRGRFRIDTASWARVHAPDLELGAQRERSTEKLFERPRDRLDILARRKPDRDVRVSRHGKERLDKVGLAPTQAVDVNGGGRERSQVELLSGCRVDRACALLRERVTAGGQLVPGAQFLRGGRDYAGAQLVGERDDGSERLHEPMERVHRRPAEQARVEVVRTGAHLDAEVREAARADLERRRIEPRHHAVEDYAGVAAPQVVGQEADNGVAARLLLTIADDAHVDRQRPAASV